MDKGREHGMIIPVNMLELIFTMSFFFLAISCYLCPQHEFGMIEAFLLDRMNQTFSSQYSMFYWLCCYKFITGFSNILSYPWCMILSVLSYRRHKYSEPQYKCKENGYLNGVL